VSEWNQTSALLKWPPNNYEVLFLGCDWFWPSICCFTYEFCHLLTFLVKHTLKNAGYFYMNLIHSSHFGRPRTQHVPNASQTCFPTQRISRQAVYTCRTHAACFILLIYTRGLVPGSTPQVSTSASGNIWTRFDTHTVELCQLVPGSAFKGPLKCFETRSVILFGDVISTEPEERAGHIEKPRLLFKMANGVLFISARARALLKLGKAAFDNHSLIDYTIESILNS